MRLVGFFSSRWARLALRLVISAAWPATLEATASCPACAWLSPASSEACVGKAAKGDVAHEPDRGLRELMALEQAIEEDGSLLDEHERQSLQEAMQALQSSLSGSNQNALDIAVIRLKSHSNAFAATRMNRNINQALQGTSLKDWH